MERKALGLLLDDDNRSVSLSCSLAQLLYLLLWTSYLIPLRLLGSPFRLFHTRPALIRRETTKVESRIANIALSIVQIIPDKNVSYSSFNRKAYCQNRHRDVSFEGSSSFQSTGPADNLVNPRDSSLETASSYTGIPPAPHPPPPPVTMFAARPPDAAHLRPQAPQPPFRRNNFENTRPATFPTRLSPPAGASSIVSDLNRHHHHRHQRRQISLAISRSLDGEAAAVAVVPISSSSLVEPIPQMPIPPVPAFLAQVPFVSTTSDSIYSVSSTCSSLFPVADQRLSAASEGKAYTGIDLLPGSGSSWEVLDGGDSQEHASSNSSARVQQHDITLAVAQYYPRAYNRRATSISARSFSAPPVTGKKT